MHGTPSKQRLRGRMFSTFKWAGMAVASFLLMGSLGLIARRSQLGLEIPGRTSEPDRWAVESSTHSSSLRVSERSIQEPLARTLASTKGIEFLGRALMGTATAVAVEGNIAYVGTGAGLLVLDVTDPGNPAELNRSFFPSPVTDVVVRGSMVVAAAGEALWVLDFSDPVEPEERAVYRVSSGVVERVVVDGPLAYISGARMLLRVLDLSDPERPEALGELIDPRHTSSTLSLTVAGRVAFIADFRGIRIVDVGDPLAPQRLGVIPVDGDAAVSGIALSGTIAYVAAGLGGLQVIDIGDPLHPRPVNSLPELGIVWDVAVGGPYVYLVAGSRLHILDGTDPGGLRAVGEVRVQGGGAVSVRLDGGLAYVVSRASLSIVDVADPLHPRRRGVIETSGTTWAVAASDGMAYVGSLHNGLWIVDVSDPVHPRRRGTVTGLTIHDVVVEGPTVFAAFVDDEAGRTGVLILDASDPDHPMERGRLELPPVAIGLALIDRWLVVADGRGGLRIIDVSDVDRPREIAQIDTAGPAFDVVTKGRVAYVADEAVGLEIIDVSDPASPQVLQVMEIGRLKQLALWGDVLFGLGTGRVVVFEVSESEQPRVTAVLDAPEAFSLPLSLAAAGFSLLVGDGGRVRLFDVSDVAAPRVQGEIRMPASVRGLSVSDGAICVADGNAGFMVLAPIDLRLPTTRAWDGGR